jgi:hypothetical protein
VEVKGSALGISDCPATGGARMAIIGSANVRREEVAVWVDVDQHHDQDGDGDHGERQVQARAAKGITGLATS